MVSGDRNDIRVDAHPDLWRAGDEVAAGTSDVGSRVSSVVEKVVGAAS